MSRYDDRYDDRRTNVSRRPRYDDDDFDARSRYDGPPPSRRPPAAETMVRERDEGTVISQGRRTERPGPRQPDFLREDYGRNDNAGPLVVREERREDDYVSRAPTRRRSLESVRSRGPPGPPTRVEKDEFVFRERDGESRGPPYPRSERGGGGGGYDEEITFKDTRSRPPPSTRGGGGYDERTEIRFKEEDRTEWMPPRRENREENTEEIRFRRGGGGRPSPPPPAPTAPPPRTEVDREEFTFSRRERSRERSRAPPPPRNEEREEITFTHRERSRERSRAPPPRSTYDREEFEFHERHSDGPPRDRGRNGGRDVDIDIDIDINQNERRGPPPRQRSQSRGQLVGRKTEEWIVRRERTPTPPPPQKDFEREEIIIRQRRERTPTPEPIREPTPEPSPPPPPPPEPIYRPPIIQEVITHHRTIDHGVQRARSPTPPPPPAPLPPPPETKEEDLQIEIRRTGTRNGKAYEEDIIIDQERKERDVREPSRQRSRSAGTRRARSHSRDRVDNRELAIRSRSRYDDQVGSRHDDGVAAEADYYNRKVSGRGYPGEAYNGATKDWGLVDIPPGTSKVAMDGIGGGRQELTWDRYAGDRHGKFYTGDRVYEQDWGRERQNGYGPPLPPPERQRGGAEETRIDIKIHEETNRGKTKDKMWTEITKDLVIKEAIEERGYEYEETDEFFYVMVYLRYVCRPQHLFPLLP